MADHAFIKGLKMRAILTDLMNQIAEQIKKNFLKFHPRNG
jgi:hypothetical protein